MLAYHYLQALELGSAAGIDTREFAEPAAMALTAAGDRAFALNACDAAARHYRSALDLLPPGDARRGRLLLRLGTALFYADETDIPLLEAGVEELLAVRDVEGAAEAERILSWHLWVAGERDRAFAHLDRALELVSDSEPSAAKANVVGTAARFRMLAGEGEEAIRFGLEALEMATKLGLDELRAAVLTNIGSAHMSAGDERGEAELREAIDVARKANAGFELGRAVGNLASILWTRGDVGAAAELWAQAEVDSDQYGQVGFRRWMQGINATLFFDLGRWDEALAVSDAFIAEVEGGSPHYLASQAYLARGLVRFARGETGSVQSDVERAVESARRAKDPQILYQTLAGAAHLLGELGESSIAFALADEFLAAISAGEGLGFSLAWTHVLSWTADEAGRGAELAAVLAGASNSAWARAAIAYGRGEPAEAADICAEIGAVAQEAYARLVAARRLVETGRRAEADVQLGRALAFYRSVGARRYVSEGESLLAATA
jgi:tetratricopeptide (TPR) repeat protein